MTPAAATAPILAASSLACRRGDRLLFRQLHFGVAPGEVVWVRGSNGRGKTSLLRLLAGLSTPAEGQVSWRGQPIRRVAADYHAALLFIAHANALKDDLTVAESLQFLARLHGQGASADSIGDALKTVGLASRRRAPIRTLSQGQKRRVALARLMLEPAKPLWILDEPFDALDVDGLAMACGVLVAHAARGGAAVLTSHVPFALECGALRELDLEACAA